MRLTHGIEIRSLRRVVQNFRVPIYFSVCRLRFPFPRDYTGLHYIFTKRYRRVSWHLLRKLKKILFHLEEPTCRLMVRKKLKLLNLEMTLNILNKLYQILL